MLLVRLRPSASLNHSHSVRGLKGSPYDACEFRTFALKHTMPRVRGLKSSLDGCSANVATCFLILNEVHAVTVDLKSSLQGASISRDISPFKTTLSTKTIAGN